MNQFICLLLSLLGSVTNLSNAQDVEISQAKVFAGYDTNEDSVLSKDEFAILVYEIERPVEAFRAMDIDENNKLEYAEAVYFHKEMIKANPDIIFDGDLAKQNILDWNGVENDFNKLETGQSFNDETEAEYLVNAIFALVDTTNQKYITESQYAEYVVKDVWDSTLSLIGGKSEINEADFIKYFFESDVYKIFKAVSEVSQADASAIDALMDTIESAHSNPDVTLEKQEKELVFEVHQFDESLSSQRRRLAIPGVVAQTTGIVAGSDNQDQVTRVFSGGRAGNCCERSNPGHKCLELACNVWCSCWRSNNVDKTCYDDYNTVDVLGRGPVYIKDVSIGDYVYDGNDYTKVYFVQQYDENILANMIEIKYGNPEHENSIILTPQHLLYNSNYEDGDKPMLSGDISIGDTLIGADNNNNNIRGYNFTVYDIQLLHDRHPINPITTSGKLMVNGVKTSVFSHSASEAKRLHEAAAVFIWISDNINEQLAATIIDFYYNIIYSRLIRSNGYMHQLLIQSQTFATMVILSVPLIFIVVFAVSKKQI